MGLPIFVVLVPVAVAAVPICATSVILTFFHGETALIFRRIFGVASSLIMLFFLLAFMVIFVAPRKGLRLEPDGERWVYQMVFILGTFLQIAFLYLGKIPNKISRTSYIFISLSCLVLALVSQLSGGAPLVSDIVYPVSLMGFYMFAYFFAPKTHA